MDATTTPVEHPSEHLTDRDRGPIDHRAGRGWRILRRLAAGVLLLATAGASFELVAARVADPPAPGELVTLPDGRRMHLQVTGRHHAGPVVVLASGMGGPGAAWGWVQDAVAERATVVSYDRAGLGWSDPSPHEPTLENVVTDLRAALAGAGLDGRGYVLVGHSLGGHHVRAFAQAHGDEVEGLVLVDPSHERQAEAFDGTYDRDARRGALLLRAMHVASRLGITRLFDPFASAVSTLPEPHRTHAAAHQATPTALRAYLAEYASLEDAGAQVAGAPGALGDVPVRVLMAGSTARPAMGPVDAINDLRRELVSLSSDGAARLVPDAEHVTLVTEPAHAQVVTDTVLELLADAR